MTARPDTRYPGPTLATRLRWFLRARPSDHLLAMSVAATSLPVIGKHLEPLGGATAMTLWGMRHVPAFWASTAHSLFTPGIAEVRKQERDCTNEVVRAALHGVVPAEDLDTDWPEPERTPPFWRALEHRRNIYRTSVQYGDSPTQLLDVWRPAELPAEPAPVLIYLPGGAWVHGSRMLQGYALMDHLAARGWVCLSIDYRVAPNHRWPQHLTDVKTAIAWARANVDKFGGDRNFIALSGGSAGGHLAALAGLTANDPDLQADLPADSDTSVDAVVGIYGRYDWEDRSTPEREEFVDFLERVVVRHRIDKHPEIFRAASPIARVRADAPPFLVIHGSADTVIPVQQARDFVAELRAVSESVVGYLELPGAGHGFDMIDGARTGSMATAIGLFLGEVYRNQAQQCAQAVI